MCKIDIEKLEIPLESRQDETLATKFHIYNRLPCRTNLQSLASRTEETEMVSEKVESINSLPGLQ